MMPYNHTKFQVKTHQGAGSGRLQLAYGGGGPSRPGPLWGGGVLYGGGGVWAGPGWGVKMLEI